VAGPEGREFIHGYPDEDGQTISGPPTACSGTGPTWSTEAVPERGAVRNQLYEDAQQYGKTLDLDPPLDPDQLYELMAAKVSAAGGDGLPIELSEAIVGGVPRRTEDNSRKLGTGRCPTRVRLPLRADQQGSTCPLGAHIRRTNPRDALGLEAGDGRMSLRHRIIRRGMPYGPFLPFQAGLERQVDDKEDRGLIFICFNASLDRQFETIQRQWCNDGNAFHLANDKDYLLGDNGPPPEVPPEMAVSRPAGSPSRAGRRSSSDTARRAHPRLRVPAGARHHRHPGPGQRGIRRAR